VVEKGVESKVERRLDRVCQLAGILISFLAGDRGRRMTISLRLRMKMGMKMRNPSSCNPITES
jgi:hypothetical protein